MIQLLGIVLIALAVVAVVRRFDVRLVLLLTALALATLGGLRHGEPGEVVTALTAVVRVFLATFSNERFVVPICTAMGFAYVLRATGCDQHLIHLLLKPVQKVRFLLIPGTVVIGFLVNIPIVSQTSTAVTLGAVVVPILLAARFSPATVGATLLLGASVGGELLNPGAPELRTVVEESERAARELGYEPLGLTGAQCVARIFPLDLIGLAVATAVFWGLSLRAERPAVRDEGEQAAEVPPDEFRVNLLCAAVPILPLVLLFLTGPPLNLIQVPTAWLVDAVNPARLTPGERGLFDSRLIGAAMLVGVLVAALVVRHKALDVTGAFFEGAGYGFTHIISLIVTANCFGKGVELIGLAQVMSAAIGGNPTLLIVCAGALPLGFGFLSGSGMAATQSLFKFFADPALGLGLDPTLVGAVVSLAAAAGRTMSPVAAVTLMCASMTKTAPMELVKRVALPLLAGVAAIVVAALVMAATGWPG